MGTRTRRAAALGVALAAALAACGGGKEPGPEARKARPPVPVLAAPAELADVPVALGLIGTVEPLQSSPVRSQVGGTVTEVRFREGDRVRAGQVLFVVDPRPIEASIRQLEATLARDEAQTRAAEAQTGTAAAQVRSAEAQLRNAESQAARYEELLRQDLVSREQCDQRTTALDAARAARDAARAVAEASRSALEAARAGAEATRAALANARLQLEYTSVKAPVAGQTGSLLVDLGDLVKANDTTLVVVNRIDPILVRFPVPEPRLPEVQQARRSGALASLIHPPGGAAARPGRIVFVDNAVDRATGTITLKSELANPDGALWPGQLVDVDLQLALRAGAVVVPAAAVQQGQQGPYVYVVEAGGAAAVRPVTTGASAGGRTEVRAGVAAGETVVTDGQLRLTPGAPVSVRDGLAPPAAAAAGGAAPAGGRGGRGEPPR